MAKKKRGSHPRATTGAVGGLERGRAEAKIQQARAFLEEARQSWPHDWEGYKRKVESVIVHARAELDQLEKEYAQLPSSELQAFRAWFYLEDSKFRVERAGHDPMLAFIKETRDIVIHESVAAFAHHNELKLGVSAHIVDSVRVTLTRPDGSTFLQTIGDGWYYLKTWIGHVRERLTQSWGRRHQERGVSPVIRRPVFKHPQCRGEAADVYVEKFIDAIARVTAAARTRFGALLP